MKRRTFTTATIAAVIATLFIRQATRQHEQAADWDLICKHCGLANISDLWKVHGCDDEWRKVWGFPNGS